MEWGGKRGSEGVMDGFGIRVWFVRSREVGGQCRRGGPEHHLAKSPSWSRDRKKAVSEVAIDIVVTKLTVGSCNSSKSLFLGLSLAGLIFGLL